MIEGRIRSFKSKRDSTTPRAERRYVRVYEECRGGVREGGKVIRGQRVCGETRDAIYVPLARPFLCRAGFFFAGSAPFADNVASSPARLHSTLIIAELAVGRTNTLLSMPSHYDDLWRSQLARLTSAYQFGCSS